jgi:hypothetical protein
MKDFPCNDGFDDELPEWVCVKAFGLEVPYGSDWYVARSRWQAYRILWSHLPEHVWATLRGRGST